METFSTTIPLSGQVRTCGLWTIVRSRSWFGRKQRLRCVDKKTRLHLPDTHSTIYGTGLRTARNVTFTFYASTFLNLVEQ